MKATRRGFMAVLAGLPLVGRLFGSESERTRIHLQPIPEDSAVKVPVVRRDPRTREILDEHNLYRVLGMRPDESVFVVRLEEGRPPKTLTYAMSLPRAQNFAMVNQDSGPLPGPLPGAPNERHLDMVTFDLLGIGGRSSWRYVERRDFAMRIE